LSDRGRFVPEQDMREFRSLLRTRKQLTCEQTRHVQRIQKTLEEANIKPDSVPGVSDLADHPGPKSGPT
jgi:transposase